MELVISEEQRMLQRSAREWVAARSPVKRARAARESGDWSRELWNEMAQLGWLDPGLPAGFSMIVLEELGRALAPEPVTPCVLLAGGVIATAGSDAQRSEHLPAIAAGERIVALAFQEPRSRWALDRIETRLEAAGGGFVVRGEKRHVMGGARADFFVVSARDEEGVTLAIVPRAAQGVTVERQRRIDGRDAAIVRFDGARIGADAILGERGRALAALERGVDRATIGLCAEMLGATCATFDMTLDYLKTRVQFGVAIGSFQALQHRAAKMFVEIELARSAVMLAHASLSDAAPDAARIARVASIAKAKCSDVGMLAAHEGIQMHGGIGMTDEHDVGLYVKRARVAEMTFGDAAFHRARFARLGASGT